MRKRERERTDPREHERPRAECRLTRAAVIEPSGIPAPKSQRGRRPATETAEREPSRARVFAERKAAEEARRRFRREASPEEYTIKFGAFRRRLIGEWE
ncbi:hypothetical protein NL676_015254 [Syzygium grande]|nr:hypothetical protein NL676_015254 [Syzygium grande]